MANQSQYSCPMHPDVQQSTAGKCSKCGMTLVQSAEKDQQAKKAKQKK